MALKVVGRPMGRIEGPDKVVGTIINPLSDQGQFETAEKAYLSLKSMR